MINRKEEIKKKGFAMSFNNDTTVNERLSSFVPVDFSKIKVGTKTLDDAILSLGDYGKVDKRLTRKEIILKSIADNNLEEMREISKFYFETSGIYSRLCKYMAYMYTYD